MGSNDTENSQVQLDALRTGMRKIAHDISTPLGVLRMVAYYLQTNQTDQEKREHYFKVISQNVDKVEAGLDRLRALTDSPPFAPPAQRPPDKETP
jgi:nitrogen-specific signal transduction histidine kinase